MPPLPNSAVEKPLPILPEQNMAQKRTTTASDEAQARTETIPNGNGIIEDRSSYLNVGANLYKEEERLKTFRDGNWPVVFLEAEKMAAAGFYYAKKAEGDDSARCIFCGVEVGRWIPGDNPINEHERWSPSCRFIKKLPCGNIPISTSSSTSTSTSADTSQSTSESQGYDVCGNFSVADLHGVNPTDNSKNQTKLLVEKHFLYQKIWEPSFPSYGTYDARIRSYESWPISLKLKPNALSSAGFFYTGRSDQTVCFHCGGGLKDWEDTDDPWVEHARWFSKCPFVLLVKGKDFVDESCGNKQPKEPGTGTSELKSSNTGDLERQSTSKSDEENLSQSSGVFSQSSNESETSNSTLCKICYAEEMGVVFLPCGHLVACTKCALSLRTCAMCREPVTGAFRAFLS